MVNEQRPHGRGPAGEGDSPVTDATDHEVTEVHDLDAADGTDDEIDEADGVDEDADGDEEAPYDDAADTGLDADVVAPEVELEDDLDPDAELEDDLDADLDDDLDADAGLADDTDLDEEDFDELETDADGFPVPVAARRRFSPADWPWVQLVQAAHAKQAIITALSMGAAAVITGRPAREAGVILVAVLVGQTMLGWHNDLVDRSRDARHQTAGKPIAAGKLDPGSVWYALIVAFLFLVPLSITTGITAGCIYMGSVAVGMLGNVLGRTGVLSFWSWAVSFAMLPAYLSYGGWGGQAMGEPPETPITVLAALLGIGVHFMRSAWGLVADHADGWTYLPLKLGLKLGATRLVALSTAYVVAVVVAIAIVGSQVGLSR